MKRWLLLVPLFFAPLIPVVARLVSGSAIPAPSIIRTSPAKGIAPVAARPVEVPSPQPVVATHDLLPVTDVGEDIPPRLPKPEPEPEEIARAEARSTPPPLDGPLSKIPPPKPPRLMVGPDGVIYQANQPLKPR